MTIHLARDRHREAKLTPCGLLKPTKDEITAGLILGRTIDTNDDTDNGIRGISPANVQRALAGSDTANIKALELKMALLDHGVPEVSIELQEGRPNDYDPWDALRVFADMSHHTVSTYSTTALTPVLSLIKRGRSDLPGPLSNGYGGWDLCYRIITFGYANHSGEGGPITVPTRSGDDYAIPLDSGRRYLWGTEWEGGIRETDWDRKLTNPRNGKQMTMREFMGRTNAALEDYWQLHEFAHLEHSTWTTRKIDRLNYTASKGIQEKDPYRIEVRDWFDMATTTDLQKAVASSPIVIDTTTGEEWPLQRVLRRILNDQDKIKAALDPTVLASAIVSNLPQSTTAPTTAEIEAAAEKAVRDVLGTLND